MVTINLLPWRERQAQYERRELMFLLIGAVVCAILFILCVDRYLSSQQDAIAEEIAHLKKELAWREGLTRHSSSPAATAQQASEINFDFFQRLNQVNAQEVCFEQIKKSKNGIELMGLTSSSEKLTHFLRRSPLVAYFSEIKVNQLQQQNGQLKFNLLGKPHAV